MLSGLGLGDAPSKLKSPIQCCVAFALCKAQSASFKAPYSLWEASGKLKGKLKKKTPFFLISVVTCRVAVGWLKRPAANCPLSWCLSSHPSAPQSSLHKDTQVLQLLQFHFHLTQNEWHLNSSPDGQSNTFSPSSNQLNSVGTSLTHLPSAIPQSHPGAVVSWSPGQVSHSLV